MKVVVTGAQGLLGREVCAVLLEAGASVCGLGRSPRRDDAYTHNLEWLGGRVAAPTPPRLRGHNARYAYRSVDLCDRPAVRALAEEIRPDVVIHAAAALRDSATDALVDSNIRSTEGVISGFGATAVGRVVLVSSGSVYGDSGGRLPFREDGPLQPVEPYGASKLEAEHRARSLAAQSGAELVVARVFNLVGPGLQDRHLPARLAGHIAEIVLGVRPPILTLGPLTATRDFIDVRDAARALVTLATTTAPPGVINVGSGIETPVVDILTHLTELAGLPELSIRTSPARASDIRRAYADVRELTELPARPRWSLPSSLQEMLQYYMSLPVPMTVDG